MPYAPAATPAIQQAQPGQAGGQSSVYNYTKTTSDPKNINAIVAGMVDRTPWRWYDTYNNPLASPAVAITNQVNFFQIPLNGTDPVTNKIKTGVDTNMTQPGQFSPPYCSVMYQLGFQIESSDVKADIDKVFNNCYMEFKILGKVFFQGKLWMFPGGLGLMGQNLTGTDQNWTNGFPAPQAAWRLVQFPRYIPPLTQFFCTLYFPGTPPTLAANFKLTAFIDGLTDLPVQ